jgi:hypothetical protein
VTFDIYPQIWCQHAFPSLSILVNYDQESFLYVDLHATPCCELLHHVSQSLHSFWGLSKNRDVVDETYIIKLIVVVGVLTAVILVLANLQTMTDPLILPSRREHPQQSVDKDVEELRGRDASLR